MMLARFGRSILLYYGCGRNTLANTARAGHTVLGFPLAPPPLASSSPSCRFPGAPAPAPLSCCCSCSWPQDVVSSASSPHWRIFRCLCQTLVILYGHHPWTPNRPTAPLPHGIQTHTLRPAFIGLKCENCK